VGTLAILDSKAAVELNLILCSLHQDYYFVGKYGSDRENFIPDVKFRGTCSKIRFDYGRFYGSKSCFTMPKTGEYCGHG